MSEKLEAMLSSQYDIYAAAREEYRKVIADQEVKIDLLRKALVTCKGDWLKTMLENKRLRAALRPFVCDCSSNCAWERDEICPDWNARAALGDHFASPGKMVRDVAMEVDND